MVEQEIHIVDMQVTNLEQLCDAVQSAQIKNKLKIIKVVLKAKAVQMGTSKVLYCCIIFIHIHSLTRAIRHAKGKRQRINLSTHQAISPLDSRTRAEAGRAPYTDKLLY